MKYLYSISITSILIAFLILWDASCRYENISFCPTADEIKAFTPSNSNISLKKNYQIHFSDKRFVFPRQTVSKIYVTQNIPFIHRFYKTTLFQKKQKSIIEFLNNPDNFTWQNITMLHSDADYIIYFYNDKNIVIGKIWFCSSCGQLIAAPFSPNMKFGLLKTSKIKEMLNLLNVN